MASDLATEMSPEQAEKLAKAFRSFRKMREDRNDLQVKVASLEKEVDAYRVIMKGVQDGQIDPSDSEEKLAEYIEDGVAPVKIASVSASGIDIGRVSGVTNIAESELDPLTAAILGQ